MATVTDYQTEDGMQVMRILIDYADLEEKPLYDVIVDAYNVYIHDNDLPVYRGYGTSTVLHNRTLQFFTVTLWAEPIHTVEWSPSPYREIMWKAS